MSTSERFTLTDDRRLAHRLPRGVQADLWELCCGEPVDGGRLRRWRVEGLPGDIYELKST